MKRPRKADPSFIATIELGPVKSVKGGRDSSSRVFRKSAVFVCLNEGGCHDEKGSSFRIYNQ